MGRFLAETWKFKVRYIIELIEVYKKGLPWITDYQILNNKRYILTNNSEKKVQLWAAESGKVIKEWQTKSL